MPARGRRRAGFPLSDLRVMAGVSAWDEPGLSYCTNAPVSLSTKPVLRRPAKSDSRVSRYQPRPMSIEY